MSFHGDVVVICVAEVLGEFQIFDVFVDFSDSRIEPYIHW